MGEYVEYQFTGMNFTSSDAFLGGSVWGFQNYNLFLFGFVISFFLDHRERKLLIAI